MSPARYKRLPDEERTWNGRLFDSKKEMQWAQKFSLLAEHGKIHNLQFQVPFVLIAKDGTERAITYRADFVFTENGKQVVLDVKGHRTEVYKIKRRLMKALLGIEIEEV